MLKIWSWNVNGLRAIMNKGFIETLEIESPDIIGLQETKLQEEQIPAALHDVTHYQKFWSHAERKGYSGVCLLTKPHPLNVTHGFNIPHFDSEGRIIIAEYENFFLINIYFPNGQSNDDRLAYKLAFYDKCLEVMQDYRMRGKAVLVTGDYNTAHKPIDLAHPKANENYSGFLPIERAWLDKIVEYGWVDTFRQFDPSPHEYSWWSYQHDARKNNVGWRIDYFFVDFEHLHIVKNAGIRQDIYGSDHCPVYVEIDID